jgi:murein DD-endopeptidase MepM/ murein hydrolase activator NlpD
LFLGYLIPEFKKMPCCTPSDYNHQSFWHWPWTRGENGHPHTGVDIFGKIGTPIKCQNGGLVIYSGYMNDTAGNTVFVLGPKWRVHMYIHLDKITYDKWSFIAPGDQIGTLGNSGNAKNTPPHLHYGIFTPIPYFWNFFIPIGKDNQPIKYNWRKMFWLNPTNHLPTC